MDRPSSTSSSKWQRWQRWPLGALFACVLLLAGELGTRAFFRPPFVSVETYTSHYPLAPLYGFEGSRACFHDGPNVTCAPTQDMNIIPHTFPLKKPPGELRIVVVGASISWEGPGHGKSDGNYPSRTIERLELSHPGKRLNLINVSVPGFGSLRQVVRFREALEYDADLFIVHTHDTNEQREDQRVAYVRELHSGIAGKLLYLNSVVVLKDEWNALLDVPTRRASGVNPEETANVDQGARLERWQAGLEAHVQTMLDLAQARSIPVILVGASRSDSVDLCGRRGRALNGFMASRARGNAVQFLDVPALFRAEVERTKRKRVFKDMIHYSGDGARIVSGALAPLVEAALPALQR